MDAATTCWVCEETGVDARLLSSCDGCGQDYHLNPYQTPGKDCGDASLDSGGEPTLEFFCRPCMDGTTAALIEARAARS